VPAAVPPLAEIPPVEFGTWEILRPGQDLAILAVGTMVAPALAAAELLEDEGLDATVVNCRFLKPLDEQMLERIVAQHPALLTVEEGTIVNGFGATIARRLEQARRDGAGLHLAFMGVPDEIIEHADRAQQLEELGLTPQGIARQARDLAAAAHLPVVRETA